MTPPTSLVSVDVLPLLPDLAGGELLLGLAPREYEPFAGQLALPGVLLGDGERLRDAACRALTAKMGASLEGVRAVGQLVTFDEPSRDPRGATLSIAMWAVVDGQCRNPAVEFRSFDAMPDLAFDHNRIVDDCRKVLAQRLWSDLDFTRAVTGDTFPGGAVYRLHQKLGGSLSDRGNYNQMMARVAGLTATTEYASTKTRGRPAKVWSWSS